MSREWPSSQKAGKCCFQWEHVEPIDTLRNQFKRLDGLGPERTHWFSGTTSLFNGVQGEPGTWTLRIRSNQQVLLGHPVYQTASGTSQLECCKMLFWF